MPSGRCSAALKVQFALDGKVLERAAKAKAAKGK
jgi:hypothetical protein